ncbi:hypothetical protein DF268_15060 [Streptomyces sp. V2]|uniref:DUF1648 domain-containing protein n=1 Tax=Streptomyces TaxID=1883 RepID=UPI0006EBC332|nr:MULTISPECIES: DUF5808 domain-containing protein [Streptomyces]PWG12794.1 hypothetical protein DF268_15060 [Streptomyces sp. V2]
MNAVLVNSALNFGILAALSAVLYAAPGPALSSPAVPFGVRVPPDRANDPAVETQRKGYRGPLLAVAAAVIVASVALGAALDTPAAGAFGAVPLCAAAATLWTRAHRRIARVKEADGWYDRTRQGVVTDMSLRTDPVRLPWAWTLPALAVTAVTAVVGAVVYPDLPARLALPERTLGGTAFREYTTSVWLAFSLVFAQALVTLAGVGAVYGILRARADLDVSRPASSAARHRRYLAVTSRALLGITALLNLMLLGMSALMWSDSRSFPLLTLTIAVPLLAALSVSAYLILRVGPSGSRLPDAPAEPSTGLVPRDDDRFWRLSGTLYANAEDPAILVPRRVGIGWTVNMGNPRSLLIASAVLAVATGAAVVLAVA